jgi:YggT family protein
VGLFLQIFLGTICAILWLLVLGRVVLTWIDPTGKSGVAVLLVRATEPMIAPVRRLIPSTGMLDIASFIVLLVLGMLWRAIL